MIFILIIYIISRIYYTYDLKTAFMGKVIGSIIKNNTEKEIN